MLQLQPLSDSNSNYGDGTIGVGVGIGIGIDKTKGTGYPLRSSAMQKHHKRFLFDMITGLS